MKSLLSFAMTAFVLLGAPLVAHACPMCFSTGENDGAFIYGSIFLMVVPVLSLGGLGYWAYRRLKAIDEGVVRPDADADSSAEAPQNNGGNAVVLQMSQRR